MMCVKELDILFKTFLYAVKMLWRIFSAALVSACAVTVVWWLLGKTTKLADTLFFFFSVFGTAVLVFTSICAIRLAVRGKKAARIYADTLVNGYTDKFFSYYENRVKRAKRKNSKNSAMLALASCYSEASRYDDAMNVLDSMDFLSMSEPMRASYFNTLLYTAILSDDLNKAEKIYMSGKYLLEKYSRGSSGCEIAHTLAALEFARGNVYTAEQMILEILDGPVSDMTASGCGVYLVMIYLQTERFEKAKLAAEMTFPVIAGYRDKQIMLRLMKIIENIYSVRGDTIIQES